MKQYLSESLDLFSFFSTASLLSTFGSFTRLARLSTVSTFSLLTFLHTNLIKTRFSLWLRFGVASYTFLRLVMWCRIQSLIQIGWELTEIKAFEVVEISWDFYIWRWGISWDLVWYYILCYDWSWDVESKVWTKSLENWLRFKHLKWLRLVEILSCWDSEWYHILC